MEVAAKKTFHRLNPQGIHYTFTLRLTGVPQSQDLVPHITLIVFVSLLITSRHTVHHSKSVYFHHFNLSTDF